MNKNFKSGFVAIIGAPNVGKSTLLNQILKQKMVIVTPKAQTTRNKIQGIYTSDDSQIIFIDTPGVHNAKSELGKVMNEYATSSLDGVDVVLFLIDASQSLNAKDQYIIDNVLKAKIPTILVANKVDKVLNDEILKENMQSYKQAFNFTRGIAISATNNYLVDDLLNMIKENLNIGPMYYPEDQLLDQSERFCVSEIIREKVLLLLDQEVPHAVAIEIERFKYYEKKNLTEILATIICERESQKKIIIGKNGQKIKEIGRMARIDIIKLLDSAVYLELFVKVEPDWRNHQFQLKNLGYNSEQ